MLLDTHAFLWWLAGDPALPANTRQLIGDPGNAVYVSAASAFEITTKFRVGKLPGAAAIAPDVEGSVRAEGFLPLAIGMTHAQRAGGLPGWHRDPFDRILIAQALEEGMALISSEVLFDRYGVPRVS